MGSYVGDIPVMKEPPDLPCIAGSSTGSGGVKKAPPDLLSRYNGQLFRFIYKVLVGGTT